MNMATHIDIPQSIASPATSHPDGESPSPPLPSPVTPTQKSSPAEKYARLESLLRQTLALAGEISEIKTPLKPARPYARPYTAGDTHTHLPRDCIILRKTSSAAMTSASGAGTGGFDVRRHSATAYPRSVPRRSFGSSGCCRGGPNTRSSVSIRIGDDDHDRNRHSGEPEGWDSSGASAGSSPSVQEPFSPETLAQSLDAVVVGAGKRRPKRRETTAGCRLAGNRPDPAPPTRSSTAAPPPPPYTPSPAPERPASPGFFPSLQTSEIEEQRLAGTPRWHVRIVPLLQRAGQEASSYSCLEPPPPPGTPVFMKLEAVFPYPCFAAADGAAPTDEGNAAAAAAVMTGWDSEGSYIIIGRRPPVVDLSPVDDENEMHLQSCEDYRRDHMSKEGREQSLQDYIEEWERATGVAEAEMEGSGDRDEIGRA